MGGEAADSPSSSVRYGHSQRDCRLFLAAQRGGRVRMDSGSGGGSTGPSLASNHRFATAMNHQLPVYFAPMADPASAGTDALLQCWDHLQAYAFPPLRLVRQVLNKFRGSANCEMTLVAPWWPQQEWFPDLQHLAWYPPVALLIRRDLLRQPHFHHYHLNPRLLGLHVWRL